MPTKKIARSAKSGKFVSAKTAKRRPATTVTETVKAKKQFTLPRDVYAYLVDTKWNKQSLKLLAKYKRA